MIVRPTVFILGAGASAPYGFPLGSGLIEKILHSLQSPEMRPLLLRQLDFSHDQISTFGQELRDSPLNSIDAFLDNREEFREIGKTANFESQIHSFSPEKIYLISPN